MLLQTTKFYIVNNYNGDVLAELENYHPDEIRYGIASMGADEVEAQAGTDWMSVYHEDENGLYTVKDCVYYSGRWYEADGYTPLNY